MHKKLRIIYFSLLLLCFTGVKVFAHEGEDHGAKKPATTPQTLTHFTVSAVSDKFEVVVYYDHIEAGKETGLRLFLSDFATNTPISKANIQVSLLNDASKKFTVTQKDSGIYTVTGIFPENKAYDLTANISAGNNADLMLIKNIEVGKELPVAAEKTEETEATEHNQISPIWYGLGGLVLGGLIIWLLMAKRRKTTH